MEEDDSDDQVVKEVRERSFRCLLIYNLLIAQPTFTMFIITDTRSVM